MVGDSGSNKLSLYVISTEILMVQACVDQSHRRNAYCSTAVNQSYRRKANCSAVPQRTICTLQRNSVRLYQVTAVLPSSTRYQVQVPHPVIHTHVLQYSGGSGILAPLVIKLCKKYGDTSQSSGTPRTPDSGVLVLLCTMHTCIIT
jgi:hypothetical protein